MIPGIAGRPPAYSKDFLDRVRPDFAVISAGKGNPYGFPHSEVSERLQSRGIQVLRTDRDGAVTVAVDRERLRIWAIGVSPADLSR